MVTQDDLEAALEQFRLIAGDLATEATQGDAGMTEIGNQVVLVALVLANTLAPALTAGWFLKRRKRATRQQRRSPLGGDLLRAPGQTLREQIEELRRDVAFDLAAMMFLPTLPLALFLLHGALLARPVSVIVLVVTFVTVAGLVAFQIRSL